MALLIEASPQISSNTQIQSSNKTAATLPETISLVNKKAKIGDTLKKKPIPEEIDKQLDIVFKTGVADLKNMPFWLKAIGGNKAAKAFVKIIENKDFRTNMNEIFKNARTKNGSNKDVIELMKEPEVLDKVFDCLKSHSEKGTLLHWILNREIVKEKFSKNVKNNQHRYLLYGEQH